MKDEFRLVALLPAVDSLDNDLFNSPKTIFFNTASGFSVKKALYCALASKNLRILFQFFESKPNIEDMIEWLNAHVMVNLNGIITRLDEPDRVLVQQDPVIENIIHT